MALKNILPAIVLTMLLPACSSGPDGAGGAVDVAAIQRTVKEVAISTGIPVTLADLRIEGMSCEMMCGGSIRKALARVSGVSATEIAFNEGDPSDHAIVTFDETQVSDTELIEAVHGVHGGQYRVTAVTITRQVKAVGSSTNDEERKVGDNGVSVYTPAAALLPSVLTLLTRILRP